ncbi:MAG: diacylglycerol kinase family lipid kinase [Lachnospiraceae bacterium]|nr:diacylglycerol kinase family lipid kinase [Lachnospiraceae bacterium]
MESFMEHIFIINPFAGQGRAVKLIPQIDKLLMDTGITYSIYITKAKGDAERFVSETLAERSDVRFYACGGDGSLHEAVNGAKGYPDAEIGVIPVGTGNDFIRNFDKKESFLDIKAQIRGKSMPCDVIDINGRYIVNMANIGFDCDAAEKAAEWKKRPFVTGTMAYVCGVAEMFVKPMGKKLSFRFGDGKMISGKFLLCTLANGCFCGGGFKSSPEAALDDGLIDVGIVKMLSRPRFVTLLPSYKTGTYLKTNFAKKKVIYEKYDSVEILAKEPVNISTDGEIREFTRIKAVNVPKAFRFIVPEK